jgi:hypothetical protein
MSRMRARGRELHLGAFLSPRESVAASELDRMYPTADTELRENPFDMGPNRARADGQLTGDLHLVQAARKQNEDLALALRQLSREIRSVQPGPMPPACTPKHHARSCEQLTGVDRFDEVVVATEKQTRHSVHRLRAIAGNEDDREPSAELLAQAGGELDAAHIGKPDLEQGEQRSPTASQLEGARSRRGYPHGEADSPECRGGEITGFSVGVRDESNASHRNRDADWALAST